MEVKGRDSDLKRLLVELGTRDCSSSKRFVTQVKPPVKGAKTVSQYNCNDFWHVFKSMWRSADLRGSPTTWTVRERKHVKELIDEQGPEAVHAFLQYVFQNWGSICQRYKINGYPNIPLLYGYRRSLFPESLNGPTVTTKPGVEFSGDEDANSFG